MPFLKPTIAIVSISIPRIIFLFDVSEATPIIYPMRDFLLKEIVVYNYHSHNTSLSITTFSTQKPNKSSIFHLAEAFVNGLQADYPQTVHTLLKSEEKLSVPERVAYYCAVSLEFLVFFDFFRVTFEDMRSASERCGKGKGQ